VIVAITGTPGTGKTSVSMELARLGHVVVDMVALARQKRLIVSPVTRGAPATIDVKKLKSVPLPKAKLVFTCSHFSHLLKADKVIVLRCSPSVLVRRLRSRGWGNEKVTENAEAEAIDLITVEAIGLHRKVYEVDTTHLKPKESARQILEIVKGAVKGHEPGHVDWSEEILSWF